MNATQKSVSDLMQGNVARLDVDTPIDEAVELLENDRISGAPVVDGAGRVVGVFSMTDVARAQGEGEVSTGSRRSEYYMPEVGIDEEADDYSAKEDYSPTALPSGTVSEWMSADVVSVAPAATVKEACQQMAEHGVHRVLVLDESRLVGILSSLDVVRWVADPS